MILVKASVKKPACDRNRPNRRLLMDFYTDGETPKPEASGVVEAALEEGRRMEVNSSSQSDAKSSLHILAHTSKAGTVQAVTTKLNILGWGSQG